MVDGARYGKQDFYRSGSIRERADEFNQLLYNDEVDMLMAAIGGNNTNSILPYIDYEYLRQHPKAVVEYSDTTALLLAIYAKTGLVTFYGPALASSLYYRVVVFKAPLQGLCYTVRDAVDWLRSPTA